MTSKSVYPTITLYCDQDLNIPNYLVDNTLWILHTILKLGSLFLPYKIYFCLCPG